MDLLLKPRDVVAHFRPDEAVHRRGREAFELAELRRHIRRMRDETVRIFLGDDGAGAFLVPRVEIGEQEADRDRRHAFGLQGARRDQPLPDGLAMPPPHQRPILPGDLLHDRVMLRALMTADMQDVAIARSRDHPRRRAVMLEDRVGRDRGAVQHERDALTRDPVALAELDQSAHDAVRRIVRRRRHLVCHGFSACGVRIGEVGERPADIDSDEFHSQPRSAPALDLASGSRSRASGRTAHPAASGGVTPRLCSAAGATFGNCACA